MKTRWEGIQDWISITENAYSNWKAKRRKLLMSEKARVKDLRESNKLRGEAKKI